MGGSIVLTMLNVHTSFTNIHNIIGESSYEFMSLVWKKIDACFCNALLLVITCLTSYVLQNFQPVQKSLGSRLI